MISVALPLTGWLEEDGPSSGRYTTLLSHIGIAREGFYPMHQLFVSRYSAFQIFFNRHLLHSLGALTQLLSTRSGFCAADW